MDEIRKLIATLFSASLLLVACSFTRASTSLPDHVLDPTFLSSPQFRQKAWPWRVTSGPSGKVYVTFVNGLYLTGVNNQRRGAVVRFNTDGTLDSTFNVGPQFGQAFAVIEQANGQVLVGALDSNESDESGLPLYRVFRLDANGTRDVSYQAPVFTGMPRYMTLQPDGKLLVTNQGGTANGGLDGLQRLNGDGTIDTAFVPPVANGVFFTNIVVDGSDRILVGGTFTSIAGQPRPGIARLLSNGTLDSTFVPSGFNSQVQMRGIAIQTQGVNAGKIVVTGGPLRTTTGSQAVCPASGTVNCPLLRLNADGSLDTSFVLVKSSSTGIISSGRPRLLSVLPDDRLLIVSSGVARFNADGSLDSTYNKPVFSSETFWQDTLADGRVYVLLSAGSTINGSTALQQLVRFSVDGTVDTGFTPGTFQREIYPDALAALSGGRFLVWGEFDTVGSTPRTGAARFNADGTLDNTYALTGIADFLGITSAEVLSDGRLLATIKRGTDPVSSFSPAIARFTETGAMDPTFIPDSTITSALTNGELGLRIEKDQGTVLVWTLTPQRVIDGSGLFFKRLNLNGSVDHTFGGLSGADAMLGAAYRDTANAITSITLGDFRILGRYADGRLIAAATKGPYPRDAASLDYSLLRLKVDGTLDTTFNAASVAQKTSQDYTATVPQYPVTRSYILPFSGVLPQADGRVIVYGSFTSFGGQPAPGIARLTSAGALDPTFAVGAGAELRSMSGRTAQIKHVTVDLDGKYWISGMFDTFGGQSAAGLVRVNADGTVDSGFSTPVAYRSYIGGSTRVVFDTANRPIVLGTFLPSADGIPDAIHRLASTQSLKSDCLFNWAELNYAEYFAPRGTPSQSLSRYYLRYYSGTNAYLGTSSETNRLYYLGPLSRGALLDLGAVATWYTTAGCN